MEVFLLWHVTNTAHRKYNKSEATQVVFALWRMRVVTNGAQVVDSVANNTEPKQSGDSERKPGGLVQEIPHPFEDLKKGGYEMILGDSDPRALISPLDCLV